MEKSQFNAALRNAQSETACVSAGCRYAVTADGQLGGPTQVQCRRYPPMAQALIGNGPQGPQHVGTFTFFPIATAICGEFAPLDGAAILAAKLGGEAA